MNQQSGSVNQKFVNELITNMEKKDIVIAGKLMNKLSSMTDSTVHRCLFEISMADDSIAFCLLGQILEGQGLSSWLKNEIVKLSLDKAMMNHQFIILFLDHSDMKTQKAAVPVFANILLRETDTHILLELIKAIGNIKEKSCIDVIADFIFYDNEELKSAAVDSLVNIGGPSALKRLSFAATTSKSDSQISDAIEELKATTATEDTISEDINDKQFAARSDTLSCLEEDSDMAKLIKMLNSDSPHDRHQAIDLLIEQGVKAIPAVSENISMKDPDSIINALDILGNIKNETAMPYVLEILNQDHPESNVRFAAYEAISRLPKTDSATALIKGVEDPVEQVRIAAASAINKNFSEILIAGLLSKIETTGRKSKQKIIVEAIIDSHADIIFSNLLRSDSFVFAASEYLQRTNTQTLTFFINILNKRGSKSVARSIQENAKPPSFDKPLSIYVVDDSWIMLKVYIKLIHNMGHKVTLFSDPLDALEKIKKRRPDLVISDLNMLHMNGLQLTAEIRKKYDSRKLPVIIITSQSSFIQKNENTGSIMPDGNIATDRDINLVLKKPTTPSGLKIMLAIIGTYK